MFPKGQMNNSYIPYTDLSLKEKEETANAEPLPKIEIEPSKDPADKRHEWTPQAEDLKAKGIAAKAAGEAEEKLT
ncbi:hypothetical protein, partial [Bacillus subtilis]|uniref:hypothetical protein n=1 Tax=Bacillus subtilis TaxID=1423 RepID=UPI003C1CB5E7